MATPSLIRRYAPYEDACPYGDEGKREHQGAPLPKRRATSNSASHRDSHAQILTVGEGLAPPEKTKMLMKKREHQGAPLPKRRATSTATNEKSHPIGWLFRGRDSWTRTNEMQESKSCALTDLAISLCNIGIISQLLSGVNLFLRFLSLIVK